MYGTMEGEIGTPPQEDIQVLEPQSQVQPPPQQPQPQQPQSQKDEERENDIHYDPHFPYGEEGNEGEEEGEGEERFPMRELSIWKIRFNPVCSFLSVALLLGMVVFCMADPSLALEEMVQAKTWFVGRLRD